VKTSKSILFLTTAFICATGVAAADPAATVGLMLTPDEIKWQPSTRVPGLETADLVGKGAGKEAGQYVYRVKYPPHFTLQAHTHPDPRTYVVISGTIKLGWGKKLDESKLKTLPAGSYWEEPANLGHFAVTGDEPVVLHITGTGPTAVNYVDPAHAPKK
jgi:quercetin dioxygenase-like cupin family protein